MRQSEFAGWIKRAYPGINYVTRDNGDIWYSNGKYLQVSARVDNVFEFHQLGSKELPKPRYFTSEDADIVKNIRDLWGEPKEAFSPRWEKNKPEEKKPEEKRPEEKKKPEEKQPRAEEKQPKKLALGRESIISMLKEKFPDTIEIIKVPGGKAVLTNGSKLTLYDYGISSKPSEFIPWAREEEVKQCVTKFIKQQHHE